MLRGDEGVEDLLRDTFAAARPGPADDLTGLRDASWARADRLRRRRALVGGATVSGAVAATAVAVLLGSSMWGGAPRTAPAPAASTATRSATVTAATATSATGTDPDWSRYALQSGTAAYRFPDLTPDPLPSGVREMSGPISQADLAGVAGGCDWAELKDRRQAVAGWSNQFEVPDAGPGWLANLGVAGFTTGTGAEAMADLRNGALPCTTPAMKTAAWEGPGDDSVLWTDTATTNDITQTTALAVVRVGDVLVAGSARSDASAAEARRIATELAGGAATTLLDEKFPPALGQPLGRSATAPNAASKPGAAQGKPVRPQAQYDFGDVFPAASQLRFDMKYHGTPVPSPLTPAAPGAQMCDNTGQPDQAARDAKPDPVSGVQQMAWAAKGTLGDASVTIGVTGWATGTGPDRFADLRRNEGSCRWSPPQQQEAWPGEDPATTWLSSGEQLGVNGYLAARRVGDVIVSVVVNDLPPAEARAEAIRINKIVTAKVTASGIPAATGR
ncbi:hypothetical protein [Knoellia koreensis]|uniref:Uncharacterized protein n=1 Tax=Knoellia koreensis TaxID=2730921 RepID=A0A849HE70_9MICO|nr:hypothetical protein [Knoellia sp. DB2414S]NNM45708.1 hypothetical protein [Knoellia sp. DB2414S]